MKAILIILIWSYAYKKHIYICLTGVEVRVSIAVIQHYKQNQFGEDRVYFMLHVSGQNSSLREVRA